MEEKQQLRKQIKELKKKQTKTERLKHSNVIFQKIENHTNFIASQTIMLYWSMIDEVHTHNFIEKWWQRKTILLPCVDGNQLKIRKYSGTPSMKKGDLFNILEPIGEEFKEKDIIDLIIVPGVAFDNQANRMGRGRGYYDKLLQSTNAFKIGICFEFQIVDKVPKEKHDITLDEVISG